MWICNADDDEKFLRHTPHKCFEEVGGGACVGGGATDGRLGKGGMSSGDGWFMGGGA